MRAVSVAASDRRLNGVPLGRRPGGFATNRDGRIDRHLSTRLQATKQGAPAGEITDTSPVVPDHRPPVVGEAMLWGLTAKPIELVNRDIVKRRASWVVFRTFGRRHRTPAGAKCGVGNRRLYPGIECQQQIWVAAYPSQLPIEGPSLVLVHGRTFSRFRDSVKLRRLPVLTTGVVNKGGEGVILRD